MPSASFYLLLSMHCRKGSKINMLRKILENSVNSKSPEDHRIRRVHASPHAQAARGRGRARPRPRPAWEVGLVSGAPLSSIYCLSFVNPTVGDIYPEAFVVPLPPRFLDRETLMFCFSTLSEGEFTPGGFFINHACLLDDE